MDLIHWSPGPISGLIQGVYDPFGPNPASPESMASEAHFGPNAGVLDECEVGKTGGWEDGGMILPTSHLVEKREVGGTGGQERRKGIFSSFLPSSRLPNFTLVGSSVLFVTYP